MSGRPLGDEIRELLAAKTDRKLLFASTVCACAQALLEDRAVPTARARQLCLEAITRRRHLPVLVGFAVGMIPMATLETAWEDADLCSDVADLMIRQGAMAEFWRQVRKRDLGVWTAIAPLVDAVGGRT